MFSTLPDLLVGGVTLPIFYQKWPNSRLLPPPTLAFLPKGQKILAILRKKVPKMAIFSPFFGYFDSPSILLPPPTLGNLLKTSTPLLLHTPY